MSDDSGTPPASVVERPGPPPLRIHHLMTFAAVGAVQLSFWRASLHPATTFTPLNMVSASIGQALSSIGLTLAIFSVYWNRKGLAALAQPGQWLLVAYAFSALRLYIALLDNTITGAQRPVGPISEWSYLLFGVLVPFCFYLWCAWRVADSLPWRILFVELAFATLIIVASPLLPMMLVDSQVGLRLVTVAPTLGCGMILLPIELWILSTEIAARRPRYWTHWVGLVLAILSAGMSVVLGAIHLVSLFLSA